MASAILQQLQSRYITNGPRGVYGHHQQSVNQGPGLPVVVSTKRISAHCAQSKRRMQQRKLVPSSLKQIASKALHLDFGVKGATRTSTQMSYGYGPSRVPESEGDIQKWTLLQVRGWVLAAFALTFLLAPGYVFNEVLPNLGRVFGDPRAYPEVWSYGQQAKGAVRHLPTLAHFAGALFFSSSVLDILIARARSHEALRFKVVGDLLAAVILVAYLTSSVVWNFYPRSDLALVVLYLLRGLWDLRIWFEENYAP